MYDLTHFGLSDMTACGARLRHLGKGSRSLQETAQRVTSHLYEEFRDPSSGKHSFVLVRFFKTIRFGSLERLSRESVKARAGGKAPGDQMMCLSLLATVGEQPAWNSHRLSVHHQAIPLPSEEILAQSPMIARLMDQFGFDLGVLMQPDPNLLMDLEQKSYNVFHVPEARNSPYVPDQDDFVIPYRIRSVLGFGGLLPSGGLFATIVFSRVPIPREVAAMFKPLAMSTKIAILPFIHGPIFQQRSADVESAS
ncbi:MAG: hypothetical protein ACE5HD_05690 [Acidobacteriota bacterium]